MRATVHIIDASHDADSGNVILVGKVVDGDMTCKPGDTVHVSTDATPDAVNDSLIAPVARNTPLVATTDSE